VIYDKHPLSVYAVAQTTFVDGQMLFDRQRDLQGRADREAERKALVDKLKKEDKAPTSTPERKPTQVTPGTTRAGRNVPR
jgi:hypothetical protein